MGSKKGGIYLKIKIPVNKGAEKFLENSQYKKIKGDDTKTIYQGVFAVDLSRETTGLKQRAFIKFCSNIQVEGGYLRRRGEHLYITPKRSARMKIRVSEDEKKMVEEDARKLGLKPEDYLRRLALQQAANNRGI